MHAISLVGFARAAHEERHCGKQRNETPKPTISSVCCVDQLNPQFKAEESREGDSPLGK